MAVGADGRTYGTIGGSLIEASAIRESRLALADKKSKTVSFELDGRDASSPGMICGGTAELLLDYLEATPENRDFSRRWHDAILHGQDIYLLTHLKGAGDSLQVLGHAVLLPGGDVGGGASLPTDDIEKVKAGLQDVSTTAILALHDTRVMVDRIRRLKTVYCFGAGHVAVPTAHLAALVGFRVVVVDDRPEYATAERFPEANKILATKDFHHALDGLEIDEDSFIVIFTRGHQFDRAVLEQALRTPAGYIGMISSRRKREAIYQALEAAGFERGRLEQVHSPIGIAIGAETPEEIAVSIVAELIKVRSETTTE
jgi:xanthine dehydrogenase accessory factor